MPTYTPESLSLGQAAPDFQLPGVDGKLHSLREFSSGQALLVMFICNHCPYVKAIEDRLIELTVDLQKMHVPVVGICSNDPVEYPEDSFENMKIRAQEKKYPFAYLQDLDQAIAHSYGAVCTPDFFVYDKNQKLQYRGRLDDSWKDPSQVKTRELYEAVKALVRGNLSSPFLTKQTPSMGCSIKWKKS